MAGRYALIVAGGAYHDAKLSRLRTPTRDADELARVLRDPEIGNFEVELVVDAEEAALRRRVATFFSDRARDDLLLLHFSCHGLKDDSGHLYFAATDTEVAQLDATAVSAEFVSRQMTRSRSRKVIALLDCCYSGAIARGLTFRGGDSVDLDDHLGGSGRVILTASSAMEYAFEGEELTGAGNPSVFTTAVVKGLETGEADRDQDHRISVEELYDYVCEQVREVTPDQTPNMLSHLEGELFVARSSYVAPVAAAELAPELRAAIDSPLAGVRVGAISELERLLAGADRALAEAGRIALDGLANDDSRRVSAAASAALGETPRATKHLAAAREETVAAKPPSASPKATPSAAATPAPLAAAEPAPSTAAPSARGKAARWAPLVLTVLGALIVLAALTVGASEALREETRWTQLLTVLAVLAAAVIALVPRRRRWLDAAEPVLAAFPLGLAAAAGGLQGEIGLSYSARAVAGGAALMLAAALCRGRPVQRPGKVLLPLIALGAVVLFITPSLKWWNDSLGEDLLRGSLLWGLAAAALIAVIAVVAGQWDRSGRWAVLVAWAGGAAFFAGLSIVEYTSYQDAVTNSGPWLALLAGAVVAGGGVYALLRPDPPPGPR